VLSRRKAFFVERARVKGNSALFDRMIASIDEKLARGEIPLHFLGQIDLTELPSHDSLADRDGLLLFFADAEDGMCGFDPASAGSAVVAPHSSLPSDEVFADASIRFESEWTIPADLRAHGIDLHVWDEESPYSKFHAQLGLDDRPIHRLFGHPQEIQSDMRLECELAANGTYCGASESYEAALAEGVEVNANRWKLLAQFDSDRSLNWMWGDAGRLYFWIRAEDLGTAGFERVWGVQQCY